RPSSPLSPYPTLFRSHGVELVEVAAHGAEHLRIEAVEAHGHPPEARGLQLARVLREQHAVGGERHVLDTGKRGQVADEIGEIRRSEEHTSELQSRENL